MITSNANPRVKQIVQWQNKAKERRRDQVFVAEGTKMFAEAPEESILEIYLTEETEAQLAERSNPGGLSGKGTAGLREKLQRVGYETVTSEVFAKISDTRSPQGILLVCRQPLLRLEELLQQPNPLFVLLENLQDPGNLGTIVRTGEGAGITGVIMSADTVDLYNPKTVRSTMGSIYRVPCLYAEDLGEVVHKMQDRGIGVYAAHLEGQEYYDSFSFAGGTAFLIGNEGNGLSERLAALADRRLKIPMEGRVESLNAGVAAALLMYEARRQRTQGQRFPGI